MENFPKLSYWPVVTQTHENERIDLEIQSFRQLTKFLSKVKPIKNKISQPLATRVWKPSRTAKTEQNEGGYLITLDYDSVKDEPRDIHEKLVQHNINHLVYTTWSHKTTGDKNNGLNRFKVLLELTATSKQETVLLTQCLAHVVGKPQIAIRDDVSEGIFFGGVHPDHIKDFEKYRHLDGMNENDTKDFLILHSPAVENKEETKQETKQDIDDFEIYIDTKGQKYTKERLQKALDIIKYEPIGVYSRRDVWLMSGLALQSTQNDFLFELWDGWSLENCSEDLHYDREEMERIWESAKNKTLDRLQNKDKIISLGTLFHLEKLFLAKQENAVIRNSDWCFFTDYAAVKPEKPKFIIENLIPENSIGFLAGEGGVGKSTFCLEIAKSISSGLPLFDQSEFKSKQGTVAIINKEDSELKIHNQVYNITELDELLIKQSFCKDFIDDNVFELKNDKKEEIKNRWVNVTRPSWAQDSQKLTAKSEIDEAKLKSIIASLENLKTYLKENDRPDLKLLIVDPLNMWHGGDQNSQQDMSLIFGAFQKIQIKLGVTVLIIHHMNKSKGFSGSHTIRDSGRFMFYLRELELKKGQKSDFIELYVNKHNDAKSNYSAMFFTRTNKGLLQIADRLEMSSDVEG